MVTLLQRVTELFVYDPETGHFTNRSSRGRAKQGKRAGSPTGHGYRRIIIDYVKHYEHHLAWLIVHGEVVKSLDHIDGNRSNNAIVNLRQASFQQNCHNRVRERGISGLLGAYFDKRSGKWFSKIEVDGKSIWLGTHASAEQAAAAYEVAALRIHGEFAIHHREHNAQLRSNT